MPRLLRPLLILLVSALLGAPAVGWAQDPAQSARGGPVVRLGLQRRPLPFPIALGSGMPAPSFREAPALGGSRQGAGLWLPPGGQQAPSLLRSDFAQLAVKVRGRGEFGGDWTRFRPCEVGLQRSCDPGLFPQLKPDVQFGIQVAGTVAERIHVDVDYDEAREFSAANNVSVRYEAPPGAVVRRVEIGDVTMTFPESRFLTQGIPAGNFGLRALTELGPVSVQTVWAQQNGDVSSREFQLAGAGAREAFVQEDTLVLDDADYVRGQFFFLVDPRHIAGFPHLDVLALEPGSASPTLAPGAEPVQLYRFENDPVTRQQVEGYIQAEAEAARDGSLTRESGWFRYLQPGVDYFLHPSGLWVALRRPLRQEEMLAVAYITASGDSVGDYNPERIHNAGGRPLLRLLKASGPRHQPGSPTWEMEMHQVYRISGSDDVEPASVALVLSLGELSAGRTFKRRATGEEITLLKLMGLDEESPVDELDPAFLYRPAQDAFEDQPPVSGTFIVFPTLRPFAEPPPLRSLALTAQETREILGADSNPTIYQTVDPVARDAGGLFRLTIPYRIRSEGVISTFSLGALGIRDGSERLWFGNRVLVAGQDYLIDYDIGQVTLLGAEALFGSDPRGRIRATWEQQALFQVAPTSIFGFNARYGLGERGALHLLGLYQREQSLQRRPQLGMEPASVLLGGVNGNLALPAPWLDRLARRLPGAGADSASFLRLQGEVALSLPNPNTRGDVYLDDFDATDEVPLSLLGHDWHLGSAPEERDGIGGAGPPALDGGTAGGLVWQHTWILQGVGGDSVGTFEGFFPRRDIDQQISIAGTEVRQPGLRLTFSGRGVGGGSSWRSLTTVLSNTGSDLTRSDFLEFYAAGGESLTLALDLGRVGEDALFLDREGRTSGVHPDTGEPWGLGFLDQEADPRRGEIWNDRLDQAGAWGEDCQGARGGVYPLGDGRANCTRGNGRNDTEDLDGDGSLAVGERVYRYLVTLDGSSPYLARTRTETGTAFQLYRVPLRDLRAQNVGGRFTDADWRAVKHLRITVLGGGPAGVSLTRLRLLGSRWVKRGEEGILLGLAGEGTGTGGSVEVGPVSALSEGAGYQSPPGVLEELDDPSLAFSGGGVEFNEKALGLEVRDLAPGERAEVYSRFPQRPRSFLTYRRLRLWVVAPQGQWGDEGPELFLKVGSDGENFYVYRTRRAPAGAGSGGVGSADWLPEVVVDFEIWLSLRRAAEEALIRNPPSPGAPPLEVWSSDSTYAVFLRDRGRAPNLAAVRELSLGVWNSGPTPVGGRVWVNELRLSGAVEDAGYAGTLSMEMEAPGLLRTSLNYSGRGPYFRQISGDPSYQGDGSLALHATLELGRAVPEGWGVSAPLSFTHTRLDQDPTFLAQSDVRADRLGGLRTTGTRETRLEVSVRKTSPVGVALLDPLLEGLTLRAGYTRSQLTTTTLESGGSGMDARVEFSRELSRRDLPLVPSAARGMLRALLPDGMAESLLRARLRWSPERIRLGTLYARRSREAYRFEQILRFPGDTLVTPTLSPREALETTAQVTLRPLEALSAEAVFFSVRDLLAPADAVQDPGLHPLLAGERWAAGPLDLGWETNRNLRTRVGFRPQLASWLRTDLALTTDYTSDRNAALVERAVLGSDTVLALLRSASGSRTTRASLTLDPAALARSVVEGEAGVGAESPGPGALVRALQSLDPLTVTRQGGLSSRFFREPVDPGVGFQLGWGDREGLRVLGADTAAMLTGRVSWSTATGLRLPWGVRIAGSYADSRIDILHQRSDREVRTRSWPDLRLSVAEVALPERVRGLLRTLSLGSGYRVSLTESTFGGFGLQRRTRRERQVPLELSASWAGNLTLRYRGSFAEGKGRDPTGDTRTERTSHTLLLSASLAETPVLRERLDGPLRATLGYQYSADVNCRVPAGVPGCVPFLDHLIRSLNLSLDTVILPLEVGLHVAYSDRRSFVGRHDGSSQFQVGIFGQFLFDGGAFVAPAGLPGR